MLCLRGKIVSLSLNKCKYHASSFLCQPQHMYSQSIRVRFAPSPTGDLHLGGLRTALYNYLFARKNGGTFVLRCEDTDQKRLMKTSLTDMYDMLEWIGILPDESHTKPGQHGPYIQSDRLSIYNKWIAKLVTEEKAYKCYCSAERLEFLRKQQNHSREIHQGYDNRCRHLSDQERDKAEVQRLSYVIRLKLEDFDGAFEDLVYGKRHYQSRLAEGDPVLIKSDGYPTYHFANVVDDHLMEITHVLRGAEWLDSTPKHLLLYRVFGWKPPLFAHLPLLMNSDGTKLSKRQEAMSIRNLKSRGYLPESVISLICLSGGGVHVYHSDVNCYGVTLDQAVSQFSLEDVKTQNACLQVDRLDPLNRSCLRTAYHRESKPDFMKRLYQSAEDNLELGEDGLSEDQLQTLDKAYFNLENHLERITTLKDLFTGDLAYLWNEPIAGRVQEAVSAVCDVAMARSFMSAVLNYLNTNSSITTDDLTSLQKNLKIKKVVVFKLARIALTGYTIGPSVNEILASLEPQEVKNRFEVAMKSLNLLVSSQTGDRIDHKQS